MDGRVKLILVIAVSVVLSYFVLQARPADAATSCARDSDCVPAQCCHATSAINKQLAPDCKGTFCTEMCVDNTLDCGQGEIKCIKNKCVVKLK